MNNAEFFEAAELLEKAKGIPTDVLFDKIATAVSTAVGKEYGGKTAITCEIDPEKKSVKVLLRKNVVRDGEITDSETEIDVSEAKKFNKNIKAGEILEVELDTDSFGRIAATTCKHVLRQGINDAEKGRVLEEFESKKDELVTAKVISVDDTTGNATVSIGHGEAFLPEKEQIPGERLYAGQLIKVYISEVTATEKGPRIRISRTHSGLVKRLFEAEVPEIFDGDVIIESVSREAGQRAKIAVSSKNEDVDPIGACIGPRGTRVNKIVDILGGEKIDVILYSEIPEDFIAAALAPADVSSVEITDDMAHACKVLVPDGQLSLAIGNKGINARLAARLTGWKIDIQPESGYFEG